MDLDNDLLALAEGSGKRKSKSSSKKSKRKRSTRDLSSASDMDMNSSDEEVVPAKKSRDDDGGNPYPLEGKYVDEADRRRIKNMSELEREGVLGERAEELHAVQERINLRRMVERKEQTERGEEVNNYSDDDGGIRTGRDRKATGTTRAKAKALDVMKRAREKKNARKERENGSDSPRRRDDGYSDSEEEPEAEESGSDEDRSSRRRPSEKAKPKRKGRAGDEPAGPTILKQIVVTRTQLSKLCNAPWFAKWVKGAWVRYLIGQNEGLPVYRICEVQDVESKPTESYRFEGTKTDVFLTLAHSTAVRSFSMDAVSNTPYSDKEYARLAQTLARDKKELPTVKEVGEVVKQLEQHTEYVMTEADLEDILKKKRAERGKGVNPAQSRALLITQRDYARSNGDMEALAQAEAELATHNTPASPAGSQETEQERMKKVNERNRASNREDIRRAEGKNQDERRRIAERLAKGEEVKVDASARVKTMTRLKYDRDEGSRPTTPLPGTPNNELASSQPGSQPPPPVASSSSTPAKVTKFGEMVASRVKVDIDLDF